jgi:hypothetical protein
MWPLHFVFLLAFAAQPQQASSVEFKPDTTRLQEQVQMRRQLQQKDFETRQKANVCYFIRSYHFRRQDGLAPVPAGVTTCTPAEAFRQKQVNATPRVMYVPLGLQPEEQDYPQK